MNIEKICGNVLSNGNTFQEIKISSKLDCIVDSDSNVYARYNSESEIYFLYQIGHEISLGMSLYDIKLEFMEYISERYCEIR